MVHPWPLRTGIDAIRGLATTSFCATDVFRGRRGKEEEGRQRENPEKVAKRPFLGH